MTDTTLAAWEARFDGSWDDFWANLNDGWRQVLGGTTSAEPPPAGPVLARRRITTDYEWLYFLPLSWLPAVTEALLWEENGMDVGPLRVLADGRPRSWDVLQLAGPSFLDLDDLRGIPIRRLILAEGMTPSNLGALRAIPGLTSLVLDVGEDLGDLPRLDDLRELVVHDGTQVTADSQVRVIQGGGYHPPFGPRDC